MDESILIEFEREGKLAPVTSFRSTQRHRFETGIILDGETSAWPRGFGLSLRPADPATKIAFEHVQRRKSWLFPRKRFEIEAGRKGNALRLEGVDRDALPPGRYELRMRVSALRLESESADIRIPSGGTAKHRFKERRPKQELALDRPISDFDRESARILKSSKSLLDGVVAAEWLEKSERRDRRKACLLNILAKLAGLPKPGDSLNRMVKHVFFADLDRIYCAVTRDFVDAIDTHFKGDAVVHPTHQRLLHRMHQQYQVSPEDYEPLRSYREKAPSSMQAVIAVPKKASDKTLYVDLDIDGANPGWDLARFVIHVGEVLDPRKTNHFKMRRKVVKAGLSDFLYYKLSKV